MEILIFPITHSDVCCFAVGLFSLQGMQVFHKSLLEGNKIITQPSGPRVPRVGMLSSHMARPLIGCEV